MQGASLAAVIVDCLKVDICSKTTEMLAAYIGLSRVRRKEALLIAEPFSPGLFCHGQPPGPEILMKVLRREITADDAEKDVCRFSFSISLSFTQREQNIRQKQNCSIRVRVLCRHCYVCVLSLALQCLHFR